MKRYSFCPVCGAPLSRPGEPGTPVRLHACRSCGFEFWQNSKPTVAAFIERTVAGEVHLLLARRGIEPHKGMWGVPGGFLSNGERPEDGLRREMQEELGVTLTYVRLLCVEIGEYPREDVAEEARFLLGLYYRAAIPADARVVAADDAAEAAWFALGSLPSEIAFASNRRALEALKAAIARGEKGPAGA